MFSFLKTKKKNVSTKQYTFKLSGLHCSSCVVNIDMALEDLPNIISSKTNYASQTTKLEVTLNYDPNETLRIIKKLGYSILNFTDQSPQSSS